MWMLLQNKLDAFTDGLLKSGAIPKDVVETLFKATADLVASKEAEKALKAVTRNNEAEEFKIAAG